MHSFPALKRATALSALVLAASLSITGCSSSNADSKGAGENTTPAAADKPESPSAVPVAPTLETAISLAELKAADREASLAACNTLLGSPLEIAEKLGYRTEQVAVQMENEEFRGNPNSPWSEAVTTTLVNGQVDLACMFKVDPNLESSTYVMLSTVGKDGTNALCDAALVCLISEDKQRVVQVMDTKPLLNGDSLNETPLKELFNKFTV